MPAPRAAAVGDRGHGLVMTADAARLLEELHGAALQNRGAVLHRLGHGPLAGRFELRRAVGRSLARAGRGEDGDDILAAKLIGPIESRLAHGTFGVDVRARFQQELHDCRILRFRGDRELDGRHAANIGVVHLGARVEQGFDDLG